MYDTGTDPVMMSVASSNSKNAPRKGRELFLPHYQGTAWSSSIVVQFMLKAESWYA